MATIAYLEDGRSISLTDEIGRGGEGAIYSSPSDILECAKIYLKSAPPETLTKLSLMVSNPPSDPTYALRKHRSISWPSALLYKSSAKSEVAGFFMPKLDLKVFQKALLFIDPQDRTARFGGGFTWKHIVTAATNLSSAVAAIHAQGYCIGDLNESNILIAPNALISLIDCDSFQVPDTAAGRTYRCSVGKPEYTAPELSGKRLCDVDRTIASDSFALAVLLFQLLMEGTHPYQAKGRLVENAPSTEAKILLGHFPYTMRGKDIAPPDHAPPYEILHPDIRKLFERCFTIGHKNSGDRPTAREWFTAFRNINKSFQQCPKNPNHLYFDHLRTCPWCSIEASRGRDPFPSPVGHQIALEDSANLLDSLEKRLEYLRPYVEMAFADGILTSEEESQLTAYGKKLQIPPKEIEKLIQSEAAKVQGERGKAPGSPEITLSQTRFEFEKIRQGTSLSGRYTITNPGGGVLTGAIKTNSAWIKPSQVAIDSTRHIQEHTFHLDTSNLALGTRHHGAIEIASNAGTVRIEISISIEIEEAAVGRWRKQLFWSGVLAGLAFGFILYPFLPPSSAVAVTEVAGLTGFIGFVAVCAIAGKWGGGIGGFFLASILQAIFTHTSMRGYSAVAWAEIASAVLYFWAKPILIAKLAGDSRARIWTAVTGVGLAVSVVAVGIVASRSLQPSPNLASTRLPVEDKLAGSSIGSATGVQWTRALGDRGAVFSSANSSRIEYPGLIPSQGTLEFWIKVNDGYRYDNSRFIPNQKEALIFSSDSEGGDVTWPGTTKFVVTNEGKLSLWMATNKYDKPHAIPTEARKTAFRFGEWHAIGISFGSQGQYIFLDGKLVASSPNRTQTFGAAGNHQQPLDVPTIGETVSHFFPRHTYEGGFDGVLAAFRISAKQSDWVLAKGISVEAAAPPGDAALNTTQLSGDASRADEPHIDSVSTVSPTDVQTITIAGKGFGVHEPYTGDSDFIQASDLTKGWNAGWAKDPGEDKATLVVSSWTDTEIVLSGFAGAYGRDQNVLSADDNLSFQVWNPQTGLGPATYRITVTAPTTPSSVTKVNISADVANGLVIEKTMPLYPPIAKAARVSGTVVMQATISQLGTVTSLQVISGPAMLQQAALDAVKTWRYRPYLINNEPVDVETTVNVTFSLGG